MTTAPKVSVLIPAYNHEQYVEETLRSIAAQDYPNIEIVIVDDCSMDATADVIERFIKQSPVEVTFRRHKTNKGVGGTLNTALGLATGDYIALFASDDLFLPARLSRQVSFMETHPQVEILYGNGWAEKPDGTRRPVHRERVRELLTSSPANVLRYLYTNKSPFFLQTALIRSDLLARIGGYDENLLADDWLMNTKIFASLDDKTQFAYVDEPVVVYRIHDKNVHQDFLRQSNLKLQFVETLAPPHLRREALRNIHRDIAATAARRGLKRQACQHAWQSFAAGGRMKDFRLMLKIVFKATLK
ncbi:MAG: glycosyltransferase [Hyphomicrobiales bacterium]|nr:glycosyltransferase [Hyphomicrobiales bacterium]